VHCVVTILDDLGAILAKVEALEPRADRLLPVRGLPLSGYLNYDVVNCFVFTQREREEATGRHTFSCGGGGGGEEDIRVRGGGGGGGAITALTRGAFATLSNRDLLLHTIPVRHRERGVRERVSDQKASDI
jgi:hypothetical protein